MRTLHRIDELRTALGAARRAGRSIGLVPTMGAFHRGHMTLIERARADCDEVVVSIFVNPAQFGPGEDLASYPRDPLGDAGRAADAGVDLLFVPSVEEIYPEGFATTVTVTGLTETLEGEQRGREHFDGVATVVAKLLNIVGPDVAYFGQKDAQQAVVIRRMVADLSFLARIEICPTVRESDGLALSSRNAYLEAADRERALALRRGLEAAELAATSGVGDVTAVIEAGRAAMADLGVEPEYFAVVHPETLAPLAQLNGSALVAVAARVGRTRLIDNALIHSPDEQRTESP
jgi:pantoate--beta-alanine ligase